jgi:ABC-2 type transport system ATP-binding protein
VLTSHDMRDIEATCERLVILDAGRVLFDGDLVDLQRRIVGKRSVQVHFDPDASGAEGLERHLARALAGLDAERVASGPHSATFVVPAERTQELVRRLFEAAPVRDLSVERQPLERLIKEIFRGGEL